MLTGLHIKNVAVIDETEIELGAGLNVLTGETGAGKSIVIGSVNMILGERGGKDLVRHGEKSALVQAVFSGCPEQVCALAQELGAECEDGELLLTRQISESGKSTCRAGGVIMTAAAMRELGGLLVDIHGQHDSQALLSPARHIGFLDSFAKERVAPVKEAYQNLYETYRALQKKLQSLTENEAQRKARIELLTFQCDEIAKAQLSAGEEEELEAEEKVLAGAEDILKSLSDAYAVLYEGEFTAYDALSAASRSLSDAADLDARLTQTEAELTDVVYKVGDLASQVRAARDAVEFDPQRLGEVQERLALLSSLKRKYGASVEEVLAYYDTISAELAAMTDGGEDADSVRARLQACETELTEAAAALTRERMMAKEQMETLMAAELSDLDMEKVAFCVGIEAASFGKNGADQVEFMISTNPGEPVKPLSKIASGGELSRIMLALKTVLADSDAVGTLIFDEIDTGVSGRAAGKIAAKLCKIAKRKQVICITHLAQIASAADAHYLIEKEVGEDASSTHIRLLNEAQRVEELSRILGGLTVTETTRSHARELLAEAEEMKKGMEYGKGQR